MQFTLSVILAALSVGQVSAFTNGTLVPSYICNPNADGLPKAFAQVLPYTRKNLQVVAFDAKASDNLKTVPQVAQTKTSLIGNSAYVLASFHNSPNKLTAIQQNIQVTTANGGPLVAGQANQLVLKATGNNVALGGALLYATAGGQRVGNFVDKGTTNTFVPFPGCGTNAQGQVSGVIQQQGVSATGTYNTLYYNAPAGATGQITLQGLSVTASGFGVWNYTFSVTGGTAGAGGNGANTGAAPANTTGTNTAATTPKTGGGKGTTAAAPAVASAANAGTGAAAVASALAGAGAGKAKAGNAPCANAPAAAPAVAAPAKDVKEIDWTGREEKKSKRWAA